MRPARNLFWAAVGLGVVGLAAVGLALSAVLSVTSFQLPALEALLRACRGLLLPAHGGLGLLALVLVGVGLAVSTLAGRSLIRQLQGQRRFVKGLSVSGSAQVGDIAFWRFEAVRPEAFCAGLLRPAIYISDSAVRELSTDELYAVACHEDYHRRRRDPLRIVITRVLADGFVFLPALRRLADRYRALAEMAADEAAVRRSGRRSLASALLRFGTSESPGVVVGIAPERIDHLLGTPPRWGTPLTVLLLSLLPAAALVVLAATVVKVGSPGSLDIVLLLAQSCMLAMVAIPTLLLLIGLVARLRIPGARFPA